MSDWSVCRPSSRVQITSPLYSSCTTCECYIIVNTKSHLWRTFTPGSRFPRFKSQICKLWHDRSKWSLTLYTYDASLCIFMCRYNFKTWIQRSPIQLLLWHALCTCTHSQQVLEQSWYGDVGLLSKFRVNLGCMRPCLNLNTQNKKLRTWWHIPVIPSLWRRRQMVQEFKATLT